MNCSRCGRKCEDGMVEVHERGTLFSLNLTLKWFPKDQENKLFKKDSVYLIPYTTGAYCPVCKKVYVTFDVE